MVVADDPDPILFAEFTTGGYAPIGLGPREPDDYSREIRAKFFIEGEHGQREEVGTALCRLFDVNNGTAEGDCTIFDLFDSVSEEAVDVFKALYELKDNEEAARYEDAEAYRPNVLMIKDVSILPERAVHLSSFLGLIIDIAGADCGIVTAFKYTGLPEGVLDMLGFRPSLHSPGVYVKDCTLREDADDNGGERGEH